MAKPIIFIAGAIPVILAILIMVPLLTETEIPSSAINPNDKIQIEFTKHDLRVVSFGITDKIVADSSQILIIENDAYVQ